MEDSWELVTVPTEIQLSRKKMSDCQASGQEVLDSAGHTPKATKSTTSPKLCGFLDKLGAKGLKTWKTRWFVFEERRCQLYYYRTPQDTVPLGSIDLSAATFTFSVENTKRINQFDICTVDRTYQLQAKDKQTMLFWLQQLQTKRREYSRKRRNLAVEKREEVSSVLQPTDGLLGEEAKVDGEEKEGATACPPVLLVPVPAPESVGEEAAIKSPASGVFSNISLTNINTEIRNMFNKRSSLVIGTQCQPNITGPLSDSEMSVLTGKGPTDSVNSMSDDRPAERPSTPTFQSHIKNSPDKAQETNTQTESCEGKGRPFSTNFDLLRRAGSLKKKFQATRALSTNSQFHCAECGKHQASLHSAETELRSKNDTIEAMTEVIENLNVLLRNNHIDRTQSSPNRERNLEQELKDREEYEAKLEDRVKKQSEELEHTCHKLSSVKERELQDTIQSYKEMTQVKDQVVLSLTNELHELMQKIPAEDPVDAGAESLVDLENNAPDDVTIPFLAQSGVNVIDQNGKLKETCQAYILQNRFLNSEILEMNHLRQDDADRLKAQAIKLATVEAEKCKYQSKYFLVLRELQKPWRDGAVTGPDEEIVNRLLEDAIEGESLERATLSRSSIAPYDRWGFIQKLEGEADEEAFLSMANKLDRRSDELKENLENVEMSVGVKWENYLLAHQTRELQKTPELKSLVRAGIPHEYRAKIWQQSIDHYVQQHKDMAGEGYYQRLLDSIEGKPSPAVKQIELDLLRTLPNNKHYDKPDADGIGKLRRILLAYSWHKPDVGYCQGLNRLVAIALLYLTEEEAFWCLVAIVEHIMPPEYYSKTLLASQADQRVLKDLLADKCPRLTAHFDSLRVDLSLSTFNWFLTVFVDNFPIKTTLRVWDSFLFEGNKVLFRYSLAVLKIHEDILLKCTDHMTVYNYLRQMPDKLNNQNTLSQMAFTGLNPFPMQKIRIRRRLHNGFVKAELAELDKLRENYVSTRSEEGPDMEVVLSDSEMPADD